MQTYALLQICKILIPKYPDPDPGLIICFAMNFTIFRDSHKKSGNLSGFRFLMVIYGVYYARKINDSHQD